MRDTNQAMLEERDAIESRGRALGPWFHNLELAGVQTAPDHDLGDYPRVKWHAFAHALTPDLHGQAAEVGTWELEVGSWEFRGRDRPPAGGPRY